IARTFLSNSVLRYGCLTMFIHGSKELSGISLGRVGTPEEIAGSIAFLLSAQASFITGQTLYVCGGGSVGHTLL
ncbi:MAG: SDR family oxidoreductase, partial [Rhodospirillales bacterium]|nr:SDR family oxidoreductase [Rhodospirillales bacterium]